MTTLAAIIAERKQTYAEIAARTGLQPRTIRQLATGETSLDRVSVGTLRKIAAALWVPVSDLLEERRPRPGDPLRTRPERLTAALRDLMRSVAPVPYPSPVEDVARDEIADVPPDEFFGRMPPIDASRG